jgi:hypothetical protein
VRARQGGAGSKSAATNKTTAPTEALREVVQGQDPRGRMTAAPANYVLRGLLRSGMGTIAGDYLFGEFDRHGHSILGNLAGLIPSDGDIVYGDIAMRTAVRLVPLVSDYDDEPDGWGVA